MLFDLAAPDGTRVEPAKMDLEGGNILARMSLQSSRHKRTSVQLFLDTDRRGEGSPFDQQQDRADLEVQHNLDYAGGHALTLGAGVRWWQDDIRSEIFSLLATPQRDSSVLTTETKTIYTKFFTGPCLDSQYRRCDRQNSAL